MTDNNYASSPNYAASPEQNDDLPRTLRRERDARDREARERDARDREAREKAEQQRIATETYGRPEPAYSPSAAHHIGAPDEVRIEPQGATVSRLDIPFLHLMTFCLKAVFAAVPAIIVLGAILWGIGHLLQVYFPQLVKMQILVWFPNG